MRFMVLGCSYRTAPLHLRERLAFEAGQLPRVHRELLSIPSVREGMVLSTCNRVELYTVVDDPTAAEHRQHLLLADSRDVPSERLQRALYVRHDEEAVLHAFRVTSSLDSMVVGEAQITGQVKEAFAQARSDGAIGPLLGRCLQRAFFVAKRVRTDTDVARYPASVSSVAVDLAGRIFSDLPGLGVTIVGAGEMAELAGRRLLAQGVSRLHVVNRSADRAEQLARVLGGSALPFEQLAAQLRWADVMICSTGAREPIVTREQLAQAMRDRKRRPLLLIDIAVPRDVAADAREVDNVYLFDVDDLEQVVAVNLNARRKAAKSAERIVRDEVTSFSNWLHHQDVVPLIRQLRQHFAVITHGEVRRTARKLKIDDPRQAAAFDKLADAIVSKLLHAPALQLKRSSRSPRAMELAQVARELFELPFEPRDDQRDVVPDTSAAGATEALAEPDEELA